MKSCMTHSATVSAPQYDLTISIVEHEEYLAPGKLDMFVAVEVPTFCDDVFMHIFVPYLRKGKR